ncbi:maintenance of telomere capping protein 1 [Nemania serpens]|nr:maintenance of telomere capping protein 1 [Nemania serpens]
MSSKRSKATTDDELGELFEGIGDDSAVKKSTKAKSTASKPRSDKPGKDILAELEDELGGEAPARPHTPRVKRTSTATPPPPAAAAAAAATARLSEDRSTAATAARKSADSTRSFHASFTPSATSSDLQDAEKRGTFDQTAPAAAAGGGGWWGGIFATATATASAAMKQAEAAYKEIQQHEEAKKWAEQVRGNVGALRDLGDDLRHRAMPTFANILHTLAPPISSHERLLIHITHDIVGYPSLDPLIYGVFSRVMSQVEGGDLLVIQRGHENTARRSSDAAFFGGASNAAGWRDGPWWRQVDTPRDLGAVKGLLEGTKLCRASAEGYSSDYLAASGGVTEAQKRALEPLSEDNPVRTSDIFLAVQAIVVEADAALFAGSTANEAEKEASAVADDSADDAQVCFAVYVLDPVHDIVYSTTSQDIPLRWIRWLDAPTPLTPASESEQQTPAAPALNVPDEIRDIVESGAVDPREWVAEWVEETLSLAVGVVAQRYVARRMGVGVGGLGKGKQKIETLLREGGGEAARAGLI